MKFFLSRREIGLSREALPLVFDVRWRLWRTPFARLHAQWRAEVQNALDEAAARGLSHEVAPEEEPDQSSRIEVWECSHAVTRAARLVPLASCLTQAMTLQMLLARRGHHCAVCIGVERRTAPAATEATGAKAGEGEASAHPPAREADLADGRFRAHAWVEWQGRVLIGGDVARWKPLTIFAPVGARSPSTPSV